MWRTIIILLQFTFISSDRISSKTNAQMSDAYVPTFIASNGDSIEDVQDYKNWWKYNILYEIFLRSFQDTNGDGIGDINGVTGKLDHFMDLGIDTLWLTPFFLSPMVDMGYDVQNYIEIDPVFGSTQDLEKLIREMEHRGMKLIIDLVINHSSDENEWFVKSIQKTPPYDDYYIWKDPKSYDKDGKPHPPNNWCSLFGGSAWEWNKERKQFYLHQFGKQQPDFNLRNKQLKEEIKKIMQFWIDKGVKGFRIDAVKYFIEDSLFRDEPLKDPKKQNAQNIAHSDLNHIHTSDLWETYEFVHELREFLDKTNQEKGGYERILVAEAYTEMNYTMAYYGTKDYKITHYPFNFGIVYSVVFNSEPVTAKSIDKVVWKWLKNMPDEGTPNWSMENHDFLRINTKTTREHSELIFITMMMLPGVWCTYYGQEIGLVNAPIRYDQIQDTLRGDTRAFLPSRDLERSPMQWDDTMNAGFTSNSKPWLPVNPNYWEINVEKQKNDEDSTYSLFKILSHLRKKDTFKYGELHTQVVSEGVYLFSRTLRGNPSYYIIVNFGQEYESVNFFDYITDSSILRIEASSTRSGYKKGTKVAINSLFPDIFILKPFSAIIFSTI